MGNEKLKWWENMYWPVWRFFKHSFHLRWFKWWYQKLSRGFSDRELWSLDCTITDFVLPRLKAFRYGTGGLVNDGPSGCPMIDGFSDNCETDDGHSDMYNEWLRILDVMIEGFTYHQLDSDDIDFGEFKMHSTDCDDREGYSQLHIENLDEEKYEAGRAEEKRRYIVIEQGMTYFAKYYQNLWDAITICVVPTLALSSNIFI